MSSTKQQRIILVTGANKGIGFEVIKKLLEESSTSNNNLILLGSRDLTRGQDALVKLGSPSNVHVLQLDTSSAESIARATDEIKQKYGGQLDVLINNAGIATTDNSIEGMQNVFGTNYYGVKMVNKHLFPLIKENGRVVNVSSQVGA
jgi:NAD(P)-dependent dehydrogenase (short-subunit alcohol dehydrogenase family)